MGASQSSLHRDPSSSAGLELDFPGDLLTLDDSSPHRGRETADEGSQPALGVTQQLEILVLSGALASAATIGSHHHHHWAGTSELLRAALPQALREEASALGLLRPPHHCDATATAKHLSGHLEFLQRRSTCSTSEDAGGGGTRGASGDGDHCSLAAAADAISAAEGQSASRRSSRGASRGAAAAAAHSLPLAVTIGVRLFFRLLRALLR